jgi:hypothetical protein
MVLSFFLKEKPGKCVGCVQQQQQLNARKEERKERARLYSGGLALST